MNYNYYFELAAILLTTIIVYDMKRKGQFYRQDARIFFGAVSCQAVFSAVDLLSCVLLEKADVVPLWINEAVLVVYFFFQAGVLFLMDNFIFAYANRSVKRRSAPYILSMVLMCANLLLVLLNPFFQCYYYLDANGGYHQGNLAAMGYYFYFLNMFLILGYLALHYNQFLQTEKNAIAIAVVTISITTFLQFSARASLIMGMGDALALLLWYITLENPNSYLDKMTDCGNGEALRRRLESWDDDGRASTIMFVNLENMQSVENNLGYDATEKIYRMVCEFLKISISDSRNVYRIDEDVFVLVSPGAIAVNRELCDIIRSRFVLPWNLGQDGDVTIHIQAFMCEFPKHFFDFASLVELQSYVRSIFTKNRSMEMLVMDGDILEKWQRYQDVEIALRKALATETLEVYYQPIFERRSKRIIALEALSRINDSKLGFIPPDEFIAIAETTGLIIPLGQLVLEKVCKFISTSLKDELDFVRVEVNLSPTQMMEAAAIENLIYIMKRYNIDPGRINFEVTESATADSPEQLVEVMEYIQSFGCSFMLDDYGTGYSNITYLSNFNFNYIKFDKTLVWSYFENDATRIILNKEFELMSRLGKDVVVEGIETKDQFEAFGPFDVCFYQGYLFSKALPESEIVEFLKNPAPEEMFVG